jgi:hypothetical protein
VSEPELSPLVVAGAGGVLVGLLADRALPLVSANLPLRVSLYEGDGHRFSVRIIWLELEWS